MRTRTSGVSQQAFSSYCHMWQHANPLYPVLLDERELPDLLVKHWFPVFLCERGLGMSALNNMALKWQWVKKILSQIFPLFQLMLIGFPLAFPGSAPLPCATSQFAKKGILLLPTSPLSLSEGAARPLLASCIPIPKGLVRLQDDMH